MTRFHVTFKHVTYRPIPQGRSQYVHSDGRFDKRDIAKERKIEERVVNTTSPARACAEAALKVIVKRGPFQDGDEAEVGYRKEPRRSGWGYYGRWLTARYFYDSVTGEFVPKQTWLAREQKREPEARDARRKMMGVR